MSAFSDVGWGGMLKVILSLLIALVVSWGAQAAFVTFGVNGGGISPPTNTVLPVISSSSPVVGTPETTTNGTWTGSPTFAYQWKSAGTNVGTNSNSYTPVTGDIGNALTVVVTATNGGGSTPATSAATSAVTSGSGNVAFTALHTYFISPAGATPAPSDSNAGTLAAPWATPNHNTLVCGDVIIVAAGSYTSQFGTNHWGAVSTCPSTTGGIDGLGGVNFAVVLCAGPNMSSCAVNGGTQEAFRVDKSNWAVEGFTATQNVTGQGACYSIVSETASNIDFNAFINNIASTCDLAGFDSYGFGSNGVSDMEAVVGAVSYNGSPGTSECGSGLSIIPGATSVSSAGTHVFVAGVFSYKNIDGANCGGSGTTDGEGIIFDSWTCGTAAYPYQGVIEQSVLWANGGPGIEVFPNHGCTANGDVAVYQIFGNTIYGNFQDTTHTGNDGELAIQNINPSSGGSYTFTDNITEATVRTTNGGALPIAGVETWCQTNCATTVIGQGNNFWQSNPTPSGIPISTAGNWNTTVFFNNVGNTTSWPTQWGTGNTYVNPNFASPSGLPTGAPSCASYTNTTDCMNTGASVYTDMTPSGTAAGLGYTPPGACAADSFYPTWLKGIVYLQWNSGSSTITENAGLITKPCGL